MWTDKEGNKLTGKQFLARWKQGIQSVTPLQQAQVQLLNYLPIFIGLIWGIILTGHNHTWWLLIILIGSLGLTAMQFLAIYQRYSMLKQFQKEVEDARKETIEISQSSESSQ
jgi:hypothetical protein